MLVISMAVGTVSPGISCSPGKVPHHPCPPKRASLETPPFALTPSPGPPHPLPQGGCGGSQSIHMVPGPLSCSHASPGSRTYTLLWARARLAAPLLKGLPALDTEFRMGCGEQQAHPALALPRLWTLTTFIRAVDPSLANAQASICSRDLCLELQTASPFPAAVWSDKHLKAKAFLTS